MTDATPTWTRRLRAATLARLAPRRKVPTVFQMEAVECGAAALAMILAYHGKHVPLEELRVACGVSRDGSKALNVLRAARGYGFTAKGLKKEPADLASLDAPVIIFWRFNHFLVLERYTGGGATLVDPALGRRHVTVEEFDRSFTGVVLQIQPGAGFARSGAAPSLLRTLTARLRGAQAALAFATLVALAAMVPGIVVPVLSTVFIDSILIGGQASWLSGVIGVALCALLVGGALTALQRFVAIRLETSVAVISSAKLFWQALRLPLAFYHQRSAADIAGRIVLNNRVAHAISSDILGGAAALVTVLVFSAVMLAYDRAMGASAIAFTLLSVAVTSLLSRKRVDLGTRLSIEHGKLNATAMNGIAIIESVKATGTEPEFFSRLMGNFAHYQNALQGFGKLTAVVDFVPKSFAALNMAVLFGMGGLRVMHGEMSFGALVAFQALAASFFVPVAAIVSTLNRLGAMRGDIVRLEDIEGSAQRYDALRTPPAPAALPEDKLEGRIEFQDVSFGYSRLEPPIVDGFSLVVEPGMRIALVGGSGCGKSTIAKLALGHYELWGGSILLDGHPVGAWSKLQRQSALASIDQDISLFSGSVRDNITMWDESVEERHLVDAASDAFIHDVIMERPGGYEAQVSEGGANFSGGQRQRLEIARALVQRPRILVVDEGTSALDPVTEEAVMGAIKRRGCTCLIVAHRLSAIRDCDQIVVLDGGRIVERGSHEDLIAQGGRYAALISAE